MSAWPHRNKTTFTAGPWYQSHRCSNDEDMYSTEIYDRDGDTIATCDWYQVPYDGGIGTNRWANAQLIATAPDMLEALESIISNLGTSDLENVISTLPEIIAKAKGELK